MQVVVVLGMHKSGTSLISEILHRSGIEMIEQDSELHYDDGFHHERKCTGDINKDLLGAWSLHSLDVTEQLRPETIDPSARADAEAFVEAMAHRGQDWGFKDPRTCLTYDFWKALLPPHKLVCVFRDAAEVQQHYAKVNKGPPKRVLDAWFSYNRGMVRAYRSAAPSDRIMIDYGRFMSDEQGLAELSRFLGRPLVDRRQHALRRSNQAPPLSFHLRSVLHLLRTARNVAGLNRRLHKLAATSLAAV
jgi:hypothetical protein